MNTPQEFWRKVDKSDAECCWEWTGGRNGDGYGNLNWMGQYPKAHRVAYVLTHGAIPDGLCVLHTCDNPACCNPAHLWLGTQKENVEDMVAKGRHRSPNGDPFARCPERRPRLERHGMAKLTRVDVAEMRRRHSAGETTAALAREFGVGWTTADLAIKGNTWASI